MKRLALISSMLVLLLSSSAFAVGMGPFLDFSGGSGEAEWDSDYYSWDIDTSTAAVGFVLDTAPTNESTFNYRLNVGIANQVMEDDFGDELDSDGVYFENTFGFAIAQNETFRWWAGPLIRIGFYSGETDSNIDIDYAEFGIGAVTGWNFKAGTAIIAPSVGFRLNGFTGTGDYGYFEEDIEGHTTTGFVNVALLF